MNLLFNALRAAVEEAARERGLDGYRVEWKHNAVGAFVIAVITNDARLSKEKLEPKPNGYRPPKRD